jgi:hypothetical protein
MGFFWLLLVVPVESGRWIPAWIPAWTPSGFFGLRKSRGNPEKIHPQWMAKALFY